jgi:hypothetical protein
VNRKRIIYVTGMKPKPDPVDHRRQLVRVLGHALARVDSEAAHWLDQRVQNFTLVSWTSLFYSAPADISTDLPGIECLIESPVAGPRDRKEADSIGLGLKRGWHLIGDSWPWLSRLIASSTLKITLGDVRRYLEDRDGVATRIRSRLNDQLLEAWGTGEHVLLIGHSLGSVIAYDCLWHLSRESGSDGRVDILLTMGSPLATRFIRKGLKGADRHGAERYPDNIDRWVNVAARGEMVALHRRIKPFFAGMLRLGLVRSIEDEGIYNHFRVGGRLNVHKSYGYLNHPVVAKLISGWLRL